MNKTVKILGFAIIMILSIKMKDTVYATDYFSATDEQIRESFEFVGGTNDYERKKDDKFILGKEKPFLYYNHPLDHHIHITNHKKATTTEDGYLIGQCFECSNEYEFQRQCRL